MTSRFITQAGEATIRRDLDARLIAELIEVVRAMASFDGRNNNAALKEMARVVLAKVEGAGAC